MEGEARDGFLIKSYQRCARTGCLIKRTTAMRGTQAVAEHISMSCPEEEVPRVAVEDYSWNRQDGGLHERVG